MAREERARGMRSMPNWSGRRVPGGQHARDAREDDEQDHTRCGAQGGAPPRWHQNPQHDQHDVEAAAEYHGHSHDSDRWGDVAVPGHREESTSPILGNRMTQDEDPANRPAFAGAEDGGGIRRAIGERPRARSRRAREAAPESSRSMARRAGLAGALCGGAEKNICYSSSVEIKKCQKLRSGSLEVCGLVAR